MSKYTSGHKIAYALTKTVGIGNVKGRKLMENADVTDTDAFLATAEALCTAREYAELAAEIRRIDFDSFFEKLDAKNIGLVGITDEEYPESLRPYTDMPLLLYTKGDAGLLNKPCFAVVGTRYPTRYGVRVTAEFTEKLAERFCIVSGMARGIDACAHRAALNAGGGTIAVLGSGADVVYPAENYSLYRDIASYGLVVSEYEPGTPATAHNFPVRNRIISGLSKSVLVTEAGIKSGTMLTINCAERQGKVVFCVPGSIYSERSGGCNRSIKECQSRAVTDVNDIYEEMGLAKTDLSKPTDIQLDFNEDAVIKSLTEKGEMHFEEILDIVDLSVPQLTALLVKMEALGLINKTKHNYWSV